MLRTPLCGLRRVLQVLLYESPGGNQVDGLVSAQEIAPAGSCPRRVVFVVVSLLLEAVPKGTRLTTLLLVVPGASAARTFDTALI